ncbi:MAG: hypothetical protein KF861_06715 [Planctomycetaceae bacterium]|nr:hypothetical protein [Planctomycetaceae bacterium]
MPAVIPCADLQITRRYLDQLVEAAVRAPSGDNLQPWQFEVHPDGRRVIIRVDATRDPSPMNAGQRMAWIAVGAAAENMLAAARFNGQEAVVDFSHESDAAVVHVDDVPEAEFRPDPNILARVTNRKLYEGRAVTDQTLGLLQERTPPLAESKTDWIVDPARIEELAEIIRQSDAVLFGNPAMREAFFRSVRFDAAADAEVDEGLSLASLEIRRREVTAFRMASRMPHWLFRAAGVARTIGAKSAQLVKSSSGVCVITTTNDTPAAHVSVGRALSRAWLALTDAGLAAQPMMSPLVLANALRHASTSAFSASERQQSATLVDLLERALQLNDGDRPAFLLRFGYATPPSGRTGRLSTTRAFSTPH